MSPKKLKNTTLMHVTNRRVVHKMYVVINKITFHYKPVHYTTFIIKRYFRKICVTKTVRLSPNQNDTIFLKMLQTRF